MKTNNHGNTIIEQITLIFLASVTVAALFVACTDDKEARIARAVELEAIAEKKRISEEIALQERRRLAKEKEEERRAEFDRKAIKAPKPEVVK